MEKQGRGKKVAIAGFGFMGRMHYGIWKKLRGARVVAVCDANLAQFTAKVKGNLAGADESALPPSIRLYADFDEMLATEPLDIVDITLPTPLHRPMAERALAAGCDVLCEKPMALNAKEADRMVAAASQAGRKLMIAQCIRFWPEYLVLETYIASGKYGKVVAADFSRFSPAPGWNNGGTSWFLDESKSGGVALDLHLHDADEIHHLFGMPSSVSSVSHVNPGGWTDFITTAYAYPGMVVTSSSSWAMTPSFVWESGFRVVFENAVVVASSRADKPLTVYPADGKPFFPKLPKATGYETEIRTFLDWVRGKPGGRPVTGGSARNSVAIVDAERKSAASGRPVRPVPRSCN
ncbi:MAG: Gfo/Idh/MocA family oxidoreductase [Kiritimatiellae bacterium]|nr:Gfo/Idh/MocA family oxidoreductase [Kiritimatiellia bacterium]